MFPVEIQNMINTTSAEQQDLQKTILLARHREELRQTDMKLVLQLDQKVSVNRYYKGPYINYNSQILRFWISPLSLS